MISKTYGCNIYAGQLGLSLFDRVVQSGKPKHKLREQYRMHPDISKGPNEREYNGELIDDPSTSAVTSKSLFWKQFVAQDHSSWGQHCRRIVVDIPNRSIRLPGSFSFQNQTIAGVVTNIVSNLTNLSNE